MYKRPTIQKQLLALLFIGVFLFIHVAKAHHTHEVAGDIGGDFKTEQVSKTNDCAVCDFHFTKDAEHQVTAIELPKSLPTSIQYLFFQNRRTASIGLSYSDRGPPALA